MLTRNDLDILQRPFEASQHKFKQGRAYIAEEAILTRIEEVDPDWSFRKLDSTQRDKQIISTFAMTIKGNTKDGVGMGMIEMSKPYTDKKTGEIKEPREVNEAEKSAATDAMRRAARLFGIGRYLLSLPKDADGNPTVTNVKQLEVWIKQYFPTQPPPPAPASTTVQASNSSVPALQDVSTTEPAETPKNAQNAQERAKTGNPDDNPLFDDIVPISIQTTDQQLEKLCPGWSAIKDQLLTKVFPDFYNAIVNCFHIYNAMPHAQNSIRLLVNDGLLDATVHTAKQALVIVLNHHEVKYGNAPVTDMTKDRVATDELPSREKLGLTG